MQIHKFNTNGKNFGEKSRNTVIRLQIDTNDMSENMPPQLCQSKIQDNSNNTTPINTSMSIQSMGSEMGRKNQV